MIVFGKKIIFFMFNGEKCDVWFVIVELDSVLVFYNEQIFVFIFGYLVNEQGQNVNDCNYEDDVVVQEWVWDNV